MKLGILFYGFRHGHINTLYKKTESSPIAEIVACIEENEKARLDAESALGAEFSEKSYDEWLTSPLVDAVAIGGAYGDRGRAIIKALRAGKHIIADKPICTSLSELDEICALAREGGLKISCMLDLRYLSQTLAAKKILDGGSLGEIRNISFNGQHCLNYGKRPSWYFEEGMHGGTVNDLAIHGLDLVRMLSGREIVAADRVRCWNSYAEKEKDFKDCALIMARLDGGAGILADVSYSAPTQAFSLPSYWEFRFWCERGMLSFNYAENKVTVWKEGESAPLVFDGIVSDNDYLSELEAEIREGRSEVTENVLASSRAALLLQAEADKEDI